MMTMMRIRMKIIRHRPRTHAHVRQFCHDCRRVVPYVEAGENVLSTVERSSEISPAPVLCLKGKRTMGVDEFV